jgi:hypothetical protein
MSGFADLGGGKRKIGFGHDQLPAPDAGSLYKIADQAGRRLSCAEKEDLFHVRKIVRRNLGQMLTRC